MVVKPAELLPLLLLLLLTTAVVVAGKEYRVKVDGYKFVPAYLQIGHLDTVVFEGLDEPPGHNLVTTEHPDCSIVITTAVMYSGTAGEVGALCGVTGGTRARMHTRCSQVYVSRRQRNIIRTISRLF